MAVGSYSPFITGEWRKLHIEELNDLYSSPGDQIKKNEMGRACSTMGEKRGVERVFWGKTKGNRPLGRPRHRGSIC